MNSILIVCLALAAVNCADIKDRTVLVQESIIQNDGNFHSDLQLDDGTKIVQDGHPKHVGSEDTEAIEGEYLFKGDDGKNYDTTYTADENGFVAHGEHLPTPPPTPEAILRSLEYISKHPYTDPKDSSLKG